MSAFLATVNFANPYFPVLVLLAAPTLILGVYWEPVARIATDSVRMLAF